MRLVRTAFNPELAISKLKEWVVLEDRPEELAQKLGLASGLQEVCKGIARPLQKPWLAALEKRKAWLDLEEAFQKIEAGKNLGAFLGASFQEGKKTALREKQQTLGDPWEAARLFYAQERVWFLGVMRDEVLRLARSRDQDIVELDEAECAAFFPMVSVLGSADIEKAQRVRVELDKKFSSLDPVFILTEMEGHCAVFFDLPNKLAYHAECGGS